MGYVAVFLFGIIIGVVIEYYARGYFKNEEDKSGR